MNLQTIQSQILRIITSQLNGSYFDSLTRFSYINEGASIFLQLIRNPDYLGYGREIIFIHKIIPKIRNTNSFECACLK